MTWIKNAPKKCFSQKTILPIENLPKSIVFLAKLFWAHFLLKSYSTFLKSVWKDEFFDTPFVLIKEKKFSSHNTVGSVYFMNHKVQNGSNHSIFRKTVFYKQVLEFHRHSQFVWRTSGRQNHLPLICSSSPRSHSVYLEFIFIACQMLPVSVKSSTENT